MIKYVTPYMINSIDFSEARVINYPVFGNEKAEILCGGITLLRKNFWRTDEFLSYKTITECERDMYLSGICRFTFTDVISIAINLSDTSGHIIGETVRFSENEECDSFATIVFPDMILENPCSKYPSKYPPEYINITVETRNPIKIEFDNNNLIDVLEYCEDPQKNGFKNKIEL